MGRARAATLQVLLSTDDIRKHGFRTTLRAAEVIGMRLAAIAAACNGPTGRLDLQFSLKLIHYCQRVWLGLRRAIYPDTSQNYFHLDCRHLDCRFVQDKSDVLIVGPVTDNPVFQVESRAVRGSTSCG
jgi:hypothetical protein